MISDHRIQLTFLSVLLVGVSLLVFGIFQPYLGPMFLALVIYIVWKPIHVALFNFLGRRKSFSAAISLLLVIVTIFLPFVLFGVLLSEDARNLYNKVSQTGGAALSVTEFTDLFRGKSSDFLATIGIDITSYASEGLRKLVENANVLFSGTLRIVFGFFLMLIALFYLFRDGDQLRKIIFYLSPLPNEYDTDIFNKVEHAVGSVVKGSLLISLAQGVLAGVGFTIFGVPNAVLWGSLAVVTSIIPYLGTAIILIPAILYLYLGGHIGAAIGLSIWGVLAVGLADNFLRMFIKTGVPIHPFIIFLSVVGGISFFGPVGLIAGPVVISLAYALFNIAPSIFKGGEGKPL